MVDLSLDDCSVGDTLTGMVPTACDSTAEAVAALIDESDPGATEQAEEEFDMATDDDDDEQLDDAADSLTEVPADCDSDGATRAVAVSADPAGALTDG